MGNPPLTFGRTGSKHLPPLGIALQTGSSSKLRKSLLQGWRGLGGGPEVALRGTAPVDSAQLRGWGLAVPAPGLAGGARLQRLPRPTGDTGGSPTFGEMGGEGTGAESTVLAPCTQLPFAGGLWWAQGSSLRVDLPAPLLGLRMNAATPSAGLRLSPSPVHQPPLRFYSRAAPVQHARSS